MPTFSQRVSWTALPRGWFPDGSLRVVAFVTPQLSTLDGSDATLADFPDFAQWPAAAVDYRVAIELNGVVYPNPAHPATVTVVTQPAARLDLWQALFPPTTLVHSFRPAPAWLSQARVKSYPAAQLRNFTRNVYRDILTTSAAVELPAVQHVQNLLAPAGFYGRDGATRRQQIVTDVLEPDYNTQRFVSPKPGAPGAAFIQHEDFLAGFQAGITDPQPLPAPVRDFHEYVSHLGHYRDLVRLLGLAVELKITFDGGFQLPFTPPDPCRVRLFVNWQPQLADSTDVRPVTHAVLRNESFLAESRPAAPMLVEGRLPLADSSRFQPIEIDQDGAAIKLRMLAENLDRSQFPAPSVTQPDRAALPSLRSGGISVAVDGDPNDPAKRPLAGEIVHQVDRGLFLSNLMRTSPDGADIHLFAEDLTRGMRFDLWDDETGRWHPLSARAGTFVFTDGAGNQLSVPTADEAITPLAPTKAPNGQVSDLHQQQTLFHWTGWSLGAHRPGKTLLRHYGPADPTFGDQDLTPGDDFKLAFDPPAGAPAGLAGFQAQPGTLPRLRFGRTYHVRARAADLAGDAVPFGDPTTQPGTPEFAASLPTEAIFYGRFEPIQAPPIAFQADRTEGESIERLVIRSNYTPDPGDPPAPAPNPATPVCARHVLPPKVSVELVERHGQLDLDAYPPVDPNFYAELAQRDAALLPGEPDPADADRVGRPIPEDQLVCTWLPDPLARGVAFLGLPGASEVTVVTFDDGTHQWPNSVPFRLVVREGSGPPQAISDADGRRLVVFLPKADVAKVRMSCHVALDNTTTNPDLNQLGLWRWLDDNEQAALLPAAPLGQVWAFTPFRTLTLVHAVRQPLATPEFQPGFTYLREFGQRFITLAGIIDFSRKSTGRVDLHAMWPEPVDDGVAGHRPTQPDDFLLPPDDPNAVPRAGHKVPVDLDRPRGTPETVVVGDVHHLGDTKRKVIRYEGQATTRFTEYFLERVTTDPDGVPLVVAGYGDGSALRFADRPVVASSVTVRSADGSAVWPRGGKLSAWTVDAATATLVFHDEAGQRVVVPLGTALEVTFVDAPISRFSETPVVVDVAASARPRSPDIDRVIPAFGWSSSTVTFPGPLYSVTSIRDGSVVRVYLRRPWWSSGQGEKLGVVLYPGGVDGTANTVPEELVPYVTQWGADPAVLAPAVPTPLPNFASFPAAVGTDRELHLDEFPHVDGQADRRVDVAAHEVAFDEAQNLWYCDIEVATGPAYQPFVRFALARYQPHAIQRPDLHDDVHLSRIVLADIMQLSPGRTAGVSWAPLSTDVTVNLTGPAYQATKPGFGPGKATVTVEERTAGVPDPDLGWTVVSSQPMQGQFDAEGGGSWHADVTLPSFPTAGRFRLVIEQFDTYGPPPGLFDEIRDRPVHTDIINLGQPG